MARTGTEENKEANKINQQEKQQAFGVGQNAINQATDLQNRLIKTGSVGANPWESSGYLANENKLQGEAIDQNFNSGKAAIQRENLSTGGLNGSVTPLAIRDQGLQSARLADQLTAERAAGDFNKNVGYQQSLAQMPLGIAGAESPYFGTSTSGQSSALKNLTDFGIAQYGPYMAAISAAGSAATKAIPAGCWIAEAIYGVNDWRTHLLRSWLNGEFKRHWYGRKIMAFYLRFGERIAERVRQYAALGKLLRPLFEIALWQAVEERKLNVQHLRLGGF